MDTSSCRWLAITTNFNTLARIASGRSYDARMGVEDQLKPEPEERVLRYLDEDVKRKQVHNEPRKMRSVISELLTRRGYAQVNSAERCVEVWSDIVGPVLARMSRPARIRKRILHVIVANSAGIQELTMRRDAILRQLGKEAPELNVVGLKFRVGVLD